MRHRAARLSGFAYAKRSSGAAAPDGTHPENEAIVYEETQARERRAEPLRGENIMNIHCPRCQSSSVAQDYDDPAIYICLECFAEFRAEPVGKVDADAADNNGQYGLFTASDEE